MWAVKFNMKKMNWRQMKRGVRLLPFFILAGWVLLHQWHILNALSPTAQQIVLFIGFLYTLVVCCFWRHPRNLDMMTKLRLIAGSIFLIWIIFQMRRLGPDLAFWGGSGWQEFYILPILVLAVIPYLVLNILCLLKDLVFVQQSKTTEFQFRLFIAGIVLFMGYPLVKEMFLPANDFEFDFMYYTDTYTDFPGLFLIGVSVIIGFRWKWIHYLKKRQKLIVFFSGLLLLALLIPMLPLISGIVQPVSTVADSFIRAVWLASSIYIGMSLFSIFIYLPAAGLLDRRTHEMTSLQRMSMVVSSLFNWDELIKKSLGLAIEIVNADFAWLEIQDGKVFELAGTEGIRFNDVDHLPPQALQIVRQEVAEREEALLINHLIRDKRTRWFKDWERNAGSLIVARLTHQNRNVGILYAASRRSFAFVEESRSLFQAFANQVAAALENARLVELSMEQERYREELRVAHEAQMRLLPQTLPKIPGIELEGFCLTANDIGGDFYDIISVSRDRLDIAIGDVSGKGASAAFYMAELKGVIQTLAAHHKSPKAILIDVNNFVRRHFEPNVFVTMIYAMYFPSKNQMIIARAGHTPVGWIQSKKMEWIEAPGAGLGLMDSALLEKNIEEKSIKPARQDTLFFYTDGLIEANNNEKEEFGEERLENWLLSHKLQTAEAMKKALQNHMNHFTEGMPRFDDMTVVILKLAG